jgi:hypothetical protein
MQDSGGFTPPGFLERRQYEQGTEILHVVAIPTMAESLPLLWGDVEKDVR